MIPESPTDDEDKPLEPRIWSWTMVLPEFIIIDTVSVAGGAYCSFAYRPDRVILFKPSSSLPSYDASRFIPPERAGRVLDLSCARILNTQLLLSKRLMLKASNTDETTQDDEVVQDSLLSSEVKSAFPSSCKDQTVSDEKVEEQAISEHASTHSNNGVNAHLESEARAQSATSPVANVSEVPALGEVLPTEATSSQALIVVPLSSSARMLSAGVHPLLSTLLPEGDALLLSEFSATHDGFLLSESAFPVAFIKLASSFFAYFLRFMRAHSYMDLLSVKKDKVVEDLKTLRCFGFNGAWLDELFAQFDHSIPAMAFEDLQQAMDAVRLQEQRNSQLRTQIEALNSELA
ncbi:hypothetical protein SESBI_40813 [Sesbania bispinosa]|nr:hypothetical protein SESBI_40813 [Sesbania bispinosa]